MRAVPPAASIAACQAGDPRASSQERVRGLGSGFWVEGAPGQGAGVRDEDKIQ